jgi:hypothetical protein
MTSGLNGVMTALSSNSMSLFVFCRSPYEQREAQVSTLRLVYAADSLTGRTFLP